MHANKGCLEIVVIDDNRRLPFHLWHFLSRYTGFGIGDIGDTDRGSRDEAYRFWDDSGPQALPTPSGDARIWWVSASWESWEERLRSIVDELDDDAPRLFLVDARGGEPTDGVAYSPQQVVDLLLTEEAVTNLRKELRFLSSYRTSPESITHPTDRGNSEFFQVHGKSTETFSSIGELIRSESPPGSGAGRATSAGASTAAEAVTHVLITGAGLEFEDRTLGESCALGMPPTRQVLSTALEELSEALRQEDLRPSDSGEDSGFPIPRRYACHQEHQLLHKAAASKNLDLYWNVLLEKELRRASAEGRHDIEAWEQETRLREAFRSQMLRSDWGHLPQTIQAAQLPWHAWLTTNYTRFADRAVEVHPTISDRPWEVISTSNEAARLQRALLHKELETSDARRVDVDDAGQGGSSPDGTAARRYLFKLHGDIGHQTTMAIAGYDKQFATPLSFPVDSLHAVYLVSYLYLEETLRGRERIVWHIVGHGLYDALLVNVINRVLRSIRSTSVFLLVDPAYPAQATGKETPADRLLRGLNLHTQDSGAHTSEVAIHQIKLDSARYLARLHARGLLRKKLASGEEWKRAVGPVD